MSKFKELSPFDIQAACSKIAAETSRALNSGFVVQLDGPPILKNPPGYSKTRQIIDLVAFTCLSAVYRFKS